MPNKRTAAAAAATAAAAAVTAANADEAASSGSRKRCKSEHRSRLWQADLDNCSERLQAIYNNSKLSDLTITFAGRCEKLKVHRLILAMSSPVFECMFYGPMSEGNEVVLPEEEAEALKWLLENHIYANKRDFPNVNTAVEVYRLADKYQIEALKLKCSSYLLKQLQGTNLPPIYETALLLEDKALIKECNMVMTFSAEAMLSSPYIGLLSRENMKRILQKKLCIASEASVFNGIIKWGKAQVSQTTPKLKGQGHIRKAVEELLPFVKFLAMSTDEFVEHVVPSKILTSEESLAVLMNIKKVKSIPLHPLCSNPVGRRYVLNWKKIHKVTLSRLFISGLERTNNESDRYGVQRHELISDLLVTKNIYLGSIALHFVNPIKHVGWIIEVTDSGYVLGKAKYSDVHNASIDSGIYSGKINASFRPPVLLRPDKFYTVWLQCYTSNSLSESIFVQYGAMNFSGTLWYRAKTEIQFWYFKEPHNITVSAEETSDEDYQFEEDSGVENPDY